MTQIRELVWKTIDQSPSIRMDLKRGIINSRALAKYIKKEMSINTGSLDAIISAIRRYKEEDPYDELRQGAIDAIKGARLSSKNHLASLTIRKTKETLDIIRKIFDTIDITEQNTLRIVHTQKAIKLIVDEEHIESIKEVFNKNHLMDETKDLGEVVIDLKETSWNTPGVLSVLAAELTLNKININETHTCMPEIIFLFEETELMRAYEVIYELSQQEPHASTE